MKAYRIVFISFCLAMGVGWAVGFGGQARIKVVDGVTVVTNAKQPSPPKDAATKLVFEEIYSAGQGETADTSFSEVSSFAVHKDGTVYVADMKESRIKVFDAKGGFVRAFGKQGQGPGELNSPIGIFISGANELYVEDALNQRLAVFALDGKFLRNISTGKTLGLNGIQMDASGRIVGRVISLGQGGKMLWEVKTFDKDLNPKSTLESVDFPNPLQAKGRINPFALAIVYQMDPAGRIFLGRNRESEIKIFSAEDKVTKRISREYDPVPITKDDKEEMLKQLDRMPSTPSVNVKEMIEFPEFFPAFAYFILTDDGRLLVRTYEKGKKKREYIWDVYDAEGRYVARFPLTVDLQVWQDEKAYGLEENEEGYKILKCFRVRWEK
jgi:hypothetical protein